MANDVQIVEMDIGGFLRPVLKVWGASTDGSPRYFNLEEMRKDGRPVEWLPVVPALSEAPIG